MRKKAIFIIYIMTMFSCAEKVTTNKIENMNTSQKNIAKQGIILPLEFKTDNGFTGADGCEVEVRDVQGKRYNIPIEWGKESLVAALPTGHFEFYEMSCGRFQWDISEHNWSKFQVLDSKFSILAPLKFKINDHLRIYADLPQEKNIRSRVLYIWSVLPADILPNVVSGYNGKMIDKEMVTTGDGKTHYLSYALNDKNKKLKINLRIFNTCFSIEKEKNPLWLGSVKVSSQYQNSSYQVNIEKNVSTFSDNFIDCVTEKIKSINLAAKNIKSVEFEF